MRLGVDVRELRRAASTGIGRYLKTFLLAARARAHEHSFILYGDAETNLEGLGWAPARRLLAPWPLADHAELPRRLADDGIELFFSPYYKAPLWCPCPYVVTVHDVMFMHVGGAANKVFERALAARLAARAAGVITVSEHSKGEIARFLGLAPEKIAVIPNAVPEGVGPLEPARRAAALAGLGLSPGFVLYVGGFKASKNVGALLDAHAALEPALRAAHPLALVGPRGAERDALAARAKDARFLEGVGDEALSALYGACAVCAVPSLHEGFGMPALEAMACGAPVVSSNRAALPEVVGAAGEVVEPDAASLSAALSRLLKDGKLRERLGRQGLERARLFSREAVGGRLFAFLEALA